VDLKKDIQALQRVRDAAEKAKIELSSSLEANKSTLHYSIGWAAVAFDHEAYSG